MNQIHLTLKSFQGIYIEKSTKKILEIWSFLKNSAGFDPKLATPVTRNGARVPRERGTCPEWARTVVTKNSSPDKQPALLATNFVRPRVVKPSVAHSGQLPEGTQGVPGSPFTPLPAAHYVSQGPNFVTAEQLTPLPKKGPAPKSLKGMHETLQRLARSGNEVRAVARNRQLSEKRALGQGGHVKNYSKNTLQICHTGPDFIANVPGKTKKMTLIKSPHVYKKSREQFQWSREKRLIIINASNVMCSLLLLLLKNSQFPGVQLKIDSYFFSFPNKKSLKGPLNLR